MYVVCLLVNLSQVLQTFDVSNFNSFKVHMERDIHDASQNFNVFDAASQNPILSKIVTYVVIFEVVFVKSISHALIEPFSNLPFLWSMRMVCVDTVARQQSPRWMMW